VTLGGMLRNIMRATGPERGKKERVAPSFTGELWSRNVAGPIAIIAPKAFSDSAAR
jgi:hypothetical protein